MPKKRKKPVRARLKRTILPAKLPSPKNPSVFLMILPWVVTALVLVVWVILAYQTYRTSTVVVTQPMKESVEFVTRAAETVGQSKTYAFADSAARLPSSTKVLVVGDIMLGRYVETLMKKNGDDYPFVRVREKLLRGHDLVLGNLEGPIDETHTQTPDSSLLFSFSPAVASILAGQGFSVLSLANNHGLDQGTGGIRDSREALRRAGIDPLGHPQHITKDDVVVKTFGEETIAMIGFHATQSGFSLEKATTLIHDVRRDYPNAFIIIFPHWGVEYQEFSNSTQKAFAHTFVDAGADAIFGHHPHVVQEAEVYANRLIVYSLGNFIFDQYFSEETQQELAIRSTITSDRVTYRFLPIRSEKSQPQLMDTEEMKTWLTAYAERSNILDLADGTLELSRSRDGS